MITPKDIRLEGLEEKQLPKHMGRFISLYPKSTYEFRAFRESDVKQFIADLLNKKIKEIEKEIKINKSFLNMSEETIYNTGLEKAKQIIENGTN